MDTWIVTSLCNYKILIHGVFTDRDPAMECFEKVAESYGISLDNKGEFEDSCEARSQDDEGCQVEMHYLETGKPWIPGKNFIHVGM